MYRLVYEPDIKQSSVDYLYKDKKIHVRLNKFGHKNQIISGFENKLSFLATFLVNVFIDEEILTQDVVKSSFIDKEGKILDNILKRFDEESLSYKYVKQAIANNFDISTDSFKIVPLGYKRIKSSLDRVGECTELNSTCIGHSGLVQFTDYFHIKDIEDYLFDDRFYVEVTKQKIIINNDKFIKKHAVKESSDYVKLW